MLSDFYLENLSQHGELKLGRLSQLQVVLFTETPHPEIKVNIKRSVLVRDTFKEL